TRPKKYSELTEAQQHQDVCDVQATNIILHGLSPDVYAHQGDDLIEYINKAMAFLYAVTSRPRNVTWFKGKVMLAEAQKAGQILAEEQLAFLADLGISEAPVAQQAIPHNSAFKTKDLDAYDLDCDDISLAKAILMANLSSYDPDFLSEDTHSSAPNDLLVLSLVEQMTDHVAHLDKKNQKIKW
nr:hypothetical protein [Tanacetum cinerariifolium]